MSSQFERVKVVLSRVRLVGFCCLYAAVGIFASSGALSAQGVEISPNVVYGNKAGLALTVDVYRPFNANGSAVVWIISGAGRSNWESKHFRLDDSGNVRLAKDEELIDVPSIRLLLNAGITVFDAHHGSAPVFPFSEHIEDIRNAVRFVHQSAQRYGIDPDRIGLWGGSGGGLLALLVGMTSDEETSDRASTSVAAIVSYFAPTDLRRHIAARPPEQMPLYRELFPDTEAYAAFSPLQHVSSGDPPTLFVHGDADRFIDPVEGRSMSQALEAQGIDTKFILIPGAGHGFTGSEAEQANQAALEWFQGHLSH